MKDSELLRKARAILAGYDERSPAGVCRAISQVAGTWDNPQAANLKRWVSSMLDGSTWLFGWLHEHGHVTEKDVQAYASNKSTKRNKEFRKKLRQTRLNWLDWMIEYCEREENAST